MYDGRWFRHESANMTRYEKEPDLLLYGDADLGAESAHLAQFAPKKTSTLELVKRDNAELEKKPTWRQSIVERIDERLSAMAASKGISHVSDEVSDFMEDALRVRLVQVAQRQSDAAAAHFASQGYSVVRNVLPVGRVIHLRASFSNTVCTLVYCIKCYHIYDVMSLI